MINNYYTGTRAGVDIVSGTLAVSCTRQRSTSALVAEWLGVILCSTDIIINAIPSVAIRVLDADS